ncbi:MAG: ArsA family ATPase [Halobaculum sp.]
MVEFVLYGGKGGVGKTTLAAATGVQLARNGRRTLVVSTDPAHSVADAFDCEVGERPTSVPPERDLFALEIDPRERFQRRYGDTFDELLGDAQSLGVDVDRTDVTDVTERGLIPGADEVAVVDLFSEYTDHDNWEAVVFDTAPTGHTLRLLELPDVMDTTVGKLLSVRNRIDSVTSTVGRLLGGDDTTNGSYGDRAEALQSSMETVKRRLQNDEQTEFRVVTLPERMAVAETRRLLDRLDEVGVPVGDVLINQSLAEPPDDCPNCTPRYERQRDVVETATVTLGPPIREVPLVADERGLDRVKALSRNVPPVSE